MEDLGLDRDSKDVSQLSDCSINHSLSTTEYKSSKDPTTPVRSKIGKKSKKEMCEKDIMAKLNEIKMNNCKTPVTKLHEITLLMKKTVVEYEITFISGTAYSPVFTVRAKNDDIIAYGRGSSKKNAKKNAAVEFLKVMDNCNDQNDLTSTTNDEDFAKKVLEKQLETNSIGVLQELCSSNHWPYPHYEYLKEVLNEHESFEFEVICSLKMFKSTAKGKSKQSTKKLAARILYDKIKCLTPEEKADLLHNEYETPSKVLWDNSNTFGNNNLFKQNLIIPSETLFEMLINLFKFSKNPGIKYLKKLKDTKKLGNAAHILYQIGKEEGFTSTYVTLGTENQNVKMLVQVTTFPLLVNIGTGNTYSEAQEAAACGILTYLKFLIQK